MKNYPHSCESNLCNCSYVPVKGINVIDVYEINHIRTAEMTPNEE